MSLEVQHLTKYYGSQAAVDDISFRVGSGEVVGFIGPNGAGKSTTMKIIIGTVPPDQGSVMIRGMMSSGHGKEIRQILGYLPEHNPLYLEMYVREYLSYVAGLYGITGKARKQRTGEVIEMTGLGPEVRKKIVNLSRGFRQRVGLAQALIHDPEILILDEPTSGLDPNQLAEIRNLISTIGKEKTILLSTHILQEVEAICDRVLIINQGRIVADESAESLKEKGTGRIRTVHVELSRPADPEIWKELTFIRNVRSIDGIHFLLETSELRDVRADVFNFAVNQHLTILNLSLKEKGLEEVFSELTRG